MSEPLDLEAELCSVSSTSHSVTLTVLGTNGETVSITMPPVMVEVLHRTLGLVLPTLASRWSPGPR